MSRFIKVLKSWFQTANHLDWGKEIKAASNRVELIMNLINYRLKLMTECSSNACFAVISDMNNLP